VTRLAGLDVTRIRTLGGGHGYQHAEVTLADGTRAFAKLAPAGAGPDAATARPDAATAFAAETNSLRWLADAGAPVPAVLGVSESALVITLIDNQESPKRGAAFRLGADLARLHAAGNPCFGASWPGVIASLPLDNTPAHTTWPSWYAEHRLLPFLRRAAGVLDQSDHRMFDNIIEHIDSLAGSVEPPSRIHGDLWSGNVLWSGGQGWLIDPAAHGGHRETDLAMLRLFGAPQLDAIMDGYQSVAPLADGWRQRIPLHQLHPLLVHVCLFGAGYRAQLRQTARAVLAGH
jgi:fructosamine-3-kinase